MAKKPEKTQQDKIDALYQWLSFELQQARDALLTELRMSSAQIGSLYSELKSDSDKASSAVSQEIRYSYKQNQTIYDGLASMLTKEVAERINGMEEKLAVLDQLQVIVNELSELKYNYMALQNVCGNTEAIVVNEINPKLDALSAIATGEVNPKLDSIGTAIAELNEKLAGVLPTEEDIQRIAESVAAAHSAKVIEAVEAIPVAENVDYNRIVEEVGDKVLDVLNQVKETEESAEEPVETNIDYDRIICGAAEKVVESLPYPEKVDYARIENAIAGFDMNALAEAVAAKVVIPAPEIDYDRLADLVVAKLAANTEHTCEVVLDDAGVAEIAEKVAEKLAPEAINYDRIAEIVEEKIPTEEPTYDLVIDEEGISAIAKGVSEEICQMCANCELECEEVPVEEPVVEEVVEEAPVEEPVVEEPVVEEAPVAEELATAVAEPSYEEIGNDLIDAETGLVIRLKRSFTAKMRQSEDKIKGYYSDLKNELTSYKKVNSNVSWHGDRFNFGRDTVAKININGKTLCFYLALDPNDPEFKTTVYHQKDVGAQKAYENTPFLVKIKSDAAAKKALRLVGYLAEKLGTAKEEDFTAVDYTEEFTYQSTKQLFDEGFIKATKEKKVDFDF